MLPNILYKHKMVRRPSDGLIYIVAGKSSYPGIPRPDHNLLHSFDFATSTWTNLRNLTLGKFGPGVVMTDDETKIIVAGGKTYTGTSYIDDFTAETYDIGANSWAPIATLPNAALAYSFAKVNGNMMALTNAPDIVYQYDITGDAWNLVADVVTDAVKFDTVIAYIADDYPQCG